MAKQIFYTNLARMNRLSMQKRAEIVRLLVEGNSIRACSRIADVSVNTVSSLQVSVGKACLQFHDTYVKNVISKRIQCDEIWSFVYCKERNKSPDSPEGSGDIWTWTALDADTKLIISFLVGERDTESAQTFIDDLYSRLIHKERMQLTTDGLHNYVDAVTNNWGSQIDFAQLVKSYGAKPAQRGDAIKKTVICGNPDTSHISTSFVERSNLSMRMGMRRFTRSTNAFSKKLLNHECSIALYFVYYNWVRQHKTLRVTPAMAAGLTKRFMTIEDIINLTDKYEGNTLGSIVS